MASEVPRLDWSEFIDRFAWHQGEHVALVGPTGQGKTTLAKAILPRRGWSIVLGTKPADPQLDALRRLPRPDRHQLIRSWPPPAHARRVLLWPKWRTPADTGKQADAIRTALYGVFAGRNWCLYVDEVRYVADQLRLGTELEMLWLQGRALGISLVAGTQRPRWVPREMWTQASHLFIWNTRDEDDLRSLGGFGGLSSKQIREIVPTLPRFHALYINSRDGQMAITKSPR